MCNRPTVGRTWLAACGLAGAAVFAQAATYYVATNGSDAAAGTSTGTPFRTVQKAMSGARAGDSVFIRAGIYREYVNVTNSGSADNLLRVWAYSNEVAEIRGSDVVTNWLPHAGFIWKVAPWTTNSQQVFADGLPLQQVGRPNDFLTSGEIKPFGSGYADMTNGTFFVDRSNKVLYVWLTDSTAPTGRTMEVSSRLAAFYGGSYTHVKGLRFRHASTVTYTLCGWPGVSLGAGCVIEECDILWTDMGGLSLGSNSRCLRCNLSNNGCTGLGFGQRTNVLVQGCTIFSNNYRHFEIGWHAGGMKNIPDGGGIVESNEVAWNIGPGIWFDYCHTGTPIVVRRNYVHHNTGGGIFLEVSRNGLVTDNLVVSNTGGICIAESDDCTVANNTVVSNSGYAAIQCRSGQRAFSTTPLIWCTFTNNVFYNNVVSANATDWDAIMPVENLSPSNLITGIRSDFNCFYRTSGPPRLAYAGEVYGLPDQWTDDTRWDGHSVFANPQFTNDFRLNVRSPCAAAGAVFFWMTNALDLAGASRVQGGHVDMGCLETDPSGAPAIAVTNRLVEAPAGVTAYAPAGTNTPDVTGLWIENLARNGLHLPVTRTSSTTWTSAPVVLRGGGLTSLKVAGTNAAGLLRYDWADVAEASNAPAHFVSTTGSNAYPYTTWGGAATTLQEAVDAAIGDDTVWVAAGTYRAGSRYYPVTNEYSHNTRLVVSRGVQVRGVAGPVQTLIAGGGSVGTNAVRCAWVRGGAVVSGFTFTNGVGYGTSSRNFYGAGVYLDHAVLSNCMVIACNAGDGAYTTNGGMGGRGGGVYAYRAHVVDCALERNNAFYGGGAFLSFNNEVRRCRIVNNTCLASAAQSAGICDGAYAPAYGNEISDCLIASNRANQFAGGLTLGSGSRLVNCTVVTNSASAGGGLWVGSGTNDFGHLSNCIVYFNGGGNTYSWGANLRFVNSCTFPRLTNALWDGGGNITNNPRLLKGSGWRLDTNSPCADAGLPTAATEDLVHCPRPLDGNNDGVAAWDMGAYEYAHPLADADQDGLPDAGELAAGSNPLLSDTDGDGMLDGAEVGAGTSPTNVFSFLGVDGVGTSPVATGLVVRWRSVSGKRYDVRRSTNLLTGPFTYSVSTNILGIAPLNTATDSAASGLGPWFYRIEISP